MIRTPKCSKTVVFLIASVLILAIASPYAITPEELQKIENAVPKKATARPRKARKLLVFNRGKGLVHTAIPYGAKAIELMAEKTGTFEVVQTEDPSIFKPENLEPFDAICFNNSNRMDFFKDPALCQSVIDFVKSGKGLVGIHAATTNFAKEYLFEWPEGAEMLGGIFDGHPWHEKVTVKIDDPDHPLNAAFKGKSFEITDEIYQVRGPYSREKLRVLLSVDLARTPVTDAHRKKMKRPDDDYAISWVRSYGKGRVFYCSFGHDHPVFWNPAVLRHILDGIQFALGDLPADTTPSALQGQASTDTPELDNLLQAVAAYDYGRSRKSLNELSRFMNRRHGSRSDLKPIERRFLTFLRSDASPAAKLFICKQLSVMGSDESVPVLAEMLVDPSTSEMARYALERIPGDKALEALRDALDKLEGLPLAGVINSLGERRDARAVDAIARRLTDRDPVVAEAAISALGKIGGAAAVKALSNAESQIPARLKPALAEARRNCSGGGQ